MSGAVKASLPPCRRTSRRERNDLTGPSFPILVLLGSLSAGWDSVAAAPASELLCGGSVVKAGSTNGSFSACRTTSSVREAMRLAKLFGEVKSSSTLSAICRLLSASRFHHGSSFSPFSSPFCGCISPSLFSDTLRSDLRDHSNFESTVPRRPSV